MTRWTATETCPCGASIMTEAYTVDQLNASLLIWRETHRHDRPEPADDTEPPTHLVGWAGDVVRLIESNPT